MKSVNLTNKQARQFILLKQGLMGQHKFIKEKGVCDYIKQAGCIQFDPIDVCGKNAELVLQSRVEGFSKDMLYKLLYKDRRLIDYLDKNMAIFNIEDWKYFSRLRASYNEYGRSMDEINDVSDEIKSIIKEKGFASSKDINLNEKVDWAWNPTTLSRAALETMYFRGELIIHHKKGTIKQYAIASEHIADEILNASDPNLTEDEHQSWRVLRRIGAVGMLWNKPSDALLGIDGLKAANRKIIFQRLFQEGKIIEITIGNIPDSFYCLPEDRPIIDRVLSDNEFKCRTEFIAPLDNMLWDRKLIKVIFGFDYKWEIYTPVLQRKYGHYVLPVLSGDRFIGRIEIVNDKKLNQLIVKNFWFEDDIAFHDRFAESIYDCIKRFSKFNNCEEIKLGCKIG
ncbi:winged helix DNA-binding domain-containing protein [Clostridium estertheticum]|uniref:winged helix-turn-helix domain-containing protein n=1 Tax=Clostridium estertheticum TaxID=238834 RepID=UPI0013E90084|nr:winged helix DNA-binding domain-containing protein [Clostridium estertheticum]MBZ9686662.1 winged helix DNA-binding domain-containing protein [Clostridium estertheticum]